MEQAADDLMNSAYVIRTHAAIYPWAKQMDEGKTWDIRRGLMELEQIFTEAEPWTGMRWSVLP